MLRINQLFFRNFLAVLALVLIASGLVTYFWFKSIYLGQVEKNLSQNIDSLSLAISKKDDLDAIVQKFKEKTKLRITIIDFNGNVLAESDKNKAKMDNHAKREEIVALKTAAVGKSIRISDTTDKNHLYVAKKVDLDEGYIYIRMAEDIEKIEEKFIKLSTQILFIFFISFILAMVIAYKINKELKDDTDNILDILHRLLEKKQFEVKRYGNLAEFNKITKLLNEVGRKLKHRQNLKAKQNAKLKLANRQKDEILSAISHEFKNPIAVITGYCETMIKNNIDEEVKKKFLQKIENSALKMSDIIDKLRLSLKLEDGKQSLKFEECNLKVMASDISYEVLQSYKGRDVFIKGVDKILKVDKVLFAIVLTNLIENALKYSQNDVEVNVNDDNIKVIDHGSGLSQKEIEKITDKFYRVSSNSWNNSLGLGLNIVDNIVKLHQFKLVITSKKGVGSTFAIYF